MEKVRAVIDSGLPKEFQSVNVEARWKIPAIARCDVDRHEQMPRKARAGDSCVVNPRRSSPRSCFSLASFFRSARAISGNFGRIAEYFNHNL